MNYRSPLMLLSAISLFVSAMCWAYASSFVGTRTGAPGESTCANCHSNAANPGPGSVTLYVSKSQFALGDTLTVTATVKHTGLTRWGFELTVLDASNNAAGLLRVTDATHTQQQTSGSRQYMFQTSGGTHAGTADSTKWSFQWIAPTTNGGPVTFYVCGLAANNTGGTGGDYTYTASKSVAFASSNNAPVAFDLLSPTNGPMPPVMTRYPQFIWAASSDPDPGDTVTYTLYASSDSLFSNTFHSPATRSATLTLGDSLLWGRPYWWKVSAADQHGASTWSRQVFSLRTVGAGDANADGVLDVSDAMFLIQFIFASGPAPNPSITGDANCDSAIDLADAVFLIEYKFAGGPAPCSGN